jgi:hypothetical protein
MDSVEKQLERAKYCIQNGCIPADVTIQMCSPGSYARPDQAMCARCMLRYVEVEDTDET